MREACIFVKVYFNLAIHVHLLECHLISGENLVLGFMGSTSEMPSYYNIFKYKYMGAAMPLALSDAKNSSDLSSFFDKYNITYVIQPSQCSPKISLTGLVTLQQQWQAAGVIGPDCSSAFVSAGLLASAWNIPLIGYVAQSVELSNKSVYNTAVRSNPSNGMFSNMVINLCSRYNWTTVGLMSETTAGALSYMRDALVSSLPNWNITVSHEERVSQPPYSTIVGALRNLSTTSRGKCTLIQ